MLMVEHNVTLLLKLFLILSTLTPAASRGQVGGVVRAGERPLPGAIVELLRDTSRLERMLTRSDGTFSFTVGASEFANALFVRRIGFRPVRVDLLTASTSSLAIELQAIPQLLTTTHVREHQSMCPILEDTRARLAWLRSATRYRPLTADDLGMWTALRSQSGMRMKPSIFEGETGAERVAVHWYTGENIARSRSTIIKGGWMFMLGSHSHPGRGLWGYPRLHEVDAHLFADSSTFARDHSFGFLAGDTTSIVFCPVSRRRSGLDGVLVLSEDGYLMSAVWLFSNPHKQAESAGGYVQFAVPSGDEKPRLLLPAFGVLWRRLVAGDRPPKSWDRGEATQPKKTI
jgi:hypothetical protein